MALVCPLQCTPTWCTIPGSYLNSWIQTPAPRFIIHVNCFRGILLRVKSDSTGFIYQFSWATVSSYSSKQSKWCSKGHFVDMIKVHTCMHTQSIRSCPTFFATLWTIAHQAPLSMGFSRLEYWSGLLCPPLGDLPIPGIQTASPAIPALQILYC